MIIVPFEKKYLSEVYSLECQCFSVPWSEKALEEELNNDNAYFLVALVKNKVVGYIGILDICGDCNITNVAVDIEYRKQGIASELIGKAIEDAEGRQSEFITLEVRQSNTPAKNLYSKFGFVEVGVRKNYYKHPTEDAVLMTRNLKG